MSSFSKLRQLAPIVLVSTLTAGALADTTACSDDKYSKYSTLATNTDVLSYCTSVYPLPTVTVTVSTDTTSTTTSTDTATTTTTDTETDTATVTTITTTTETTTSTETDTATTTTTVNYGGGAKKRRGFNPDDVVETITVTNTKTAPCNTVPTCDPSWSDWSDPAASSTWSGWADPRTTSVWSDWSKGSGASTKDSSSWDGSTKGPHSDDGTTKGPSPGDDTTTKPPFGDDTTTIPPFGNGTTASPTSKDSTTKPTTSGAWNWDLLGSDPLSYLTQAPTSIIASICTCIEVPVTTTVTDITTIVPTATITVTITTGTLTSVTTTETATSTETDTETDTATTTTTVTATATCPASSPTVCGGNSCKNLQTDKFNCGGCGNKCATGLGCVSGRCVQNDACTYSGTIYYCYGGTTCACYGTTESRGFCADPNSSCGGACNTSDDCPGNNVCLASASVGCGSAVGYCSTNADLATCPNPANGYRMFAREVVEKRAVSSTGRNIPDQ